MGKTVTKNVPKEISYIVYSLVILNFVLVCTRIFIFGFFTPNDVSVIHWTEITVAIITGTLIGLLTAYRFR